MIFTEKKITINNNQCKIDSPVVLYRGDYNVEVRFTIVSCPYKYSKQNESNVIETTEASYGQLVIKTPNDKPPIFSERTATNNGAITFVITGEMIDEINELGQYTFQIRLFDEERASRATIAEVVNGIEIREPIATEDVSTTNEVGEATIGYALTTGTTETLDVFDEHGNYIKTHWSAGDKITAQKLNKMETGIDEVNKKVASGGTGSNNASDISIADTGNYFTSTNVEGALQEAGSQIKDIANEDLTIGIDGKLYIKQSDGTKKGNGVELPSSGENTGLNPCFITTDTKNATDKLNIITHSSGKNQPIHPKVLYFENKFGGHYFWMAYTPYPNSNDGEENPCIAYSDNLIDWYTPEGVTNPLDRGTNSEYMSDTHLVYNYNTQLLEIWYRQASTINRTETIFRRTTRDGITWNEREQMYQSTGGISNILSPCINYENDKYKIWAGSGNPSGNLKYYESSDGTNWSLVNTTNLVGWHFDVIKTDLGYECFISDTQPGASISYSKSIDGINWDEKIQLLTAGESGKWDSSRLYRTTALKLNGIYYVFYTGVCDNTWGIGLTISTIKNDITSIKGYLSGEMKINPTVSELNMTVEDLISEIIFLTKRVDALENGTVIINNITLNYNTKTINVDSTLQLEATVIPITADTSDLTWSSNNSNATVTSSGLVTAKNVGDSIITCSSLSNTQIYDQCILTIIEKDGFINKLTDINFYDGLLNYETGAIIDNSGYTYSDLIDISEYTDISVVFNNNTNKDNRVIFYDSSNNYISYVAEASNNIYFSMPENSKYIRISGSKTGLTRIDLNDITKGDNIYTGTTLTNQYYDATTGKLRNENNINCALINVDSSLTYELVNVISGAFFDSDNTFISGIPFYEDTNIRNVTSPSNCVSMGLNYRASNESVVSCKKSLSTLIGYKNF